MKVPQIYLHHEFFGLILLRVMACWKHVPPSNLITKHKRHRSTYLLQSFSLLHPPQFHFHLHRIQSRGLPSSQSHSHPHHIQSRGHLSSPLHHPPQSHFHLRHIQNRDRPSSQSHSRPHRTQSHGLLSSRSHFHLRHIQSRGLRALSNPRGVVSIHFP